ncbi:S1 RNA-binding domain-containing protein [bacterium]|nr:S1 RNA-binding domain-containing protein [bacterium]MBU1598929.1 S1 RNA-binding domain-containing protein [bacterium]
MPEIGEIAEGKVIGITNFGAFVQFDDGKRGLVHISKITEGFVKNVGDYLQMNDAVVVKIISKDKKGNLNLSIKDIEGEGLVVQAKKDSFSNPERRDSFERKMSEFLRESEEKLYDLKKNIDGKLGVKKEKVRK